MFPTLITDKLNSGLCLSRLCTITCTVTHYLVYGTLMFQTLTSVKCSRVRTRCVRTRSVRSAVTASSRASLSTPASSPASVQLLSKALKAKSLVKQLKIGVRFNKACVSHVHIASDMRLGACWSTITDGECEKELSLKVTRAQCCGSVGRAWGSPCEPCTLQGDCQPGFYMSQAGVCTDIDECALFSGLCAGGRCINTQGSYTCQCHGGLSLDPTGQRCVGTTCSDVT